MACFNYILWSVKYQLCKYGPLKLYTRRQKWRQVSLALLLFLSLRLGNNISEADAIFCVLQGEVIPDKFESKRKRYRLGKVPGSTFFKWGRERVSKRRRPAPAIPAVRLFARPTGGRLDRYPFINPIRGGHPNNHKKRRAKPVFSSWR